MASKKQTIITLNGKRYDALTGQATDDVVSTRHTSGPIMDIVAPRSAHRTQVSMPTPSPSANPSGPKVMDVARSTVHLKPRQPQRASTLVRGAVSKPKPGLKSQLTVVSPAINNAIIENNVQPKWSVAQINPTRQNRAGRITKSDAISRFSGTAFASTELSPQAVAAVRIESANEPVAIQETTESSSDDFFARALVAAEARTDEKYDTKQNAKLARRQAKLASKTSKKPVHHHVASVVAASLAVLVIGGLVGLQHKNDLTMRFANAQAGFEASLPTYQPDGYGVGSFTYSAGNVGTSFHNQAGNRDYSLNQQTTKWDDQALLDTYVKVNYPGYQVLQSGSQILYVYGKNDASWIKNGIWYQLKADGNLSTSQVLNIAASI